MGKTESRESKTLGNSDYRLIVIYDEPVEFLRMVFHENVPNKIPYGKYRVKRIKRNLSDKLTIPPIRMKQ